MAVSRHHLLWYRRDWHEGYANFLRCRFVYLIDDDLHKELHETLLNIPVPLDVEWLAMQKPRFADPIDACDWFIENSGDEAFVEAMKLQRAFLLQSRPP